MKIVRTKEERNDKQKWVPSGPSWVSFLMRQLRNVYGACRIYNNLELAKEAAEKLFVFNPNNAGLGCTLLLSMSLKIFSWVCLKYCVCF